VDPPILTGRPEDVTVEEHKTASFTCTFNSSSIPDLSLCSWSSDDGEISLFKRYHITTDWVKNQFVCTLHIIDVTKEDASKYTCYCYYNDSFKFYRDPKKPHEIQSNRGEATLHGGFILNK